MEYIVIFSFSKKGHELARRISGFYPHARHICEYKEQKLRDQIEQVFCQNYTLIFVGAIGIAVRGIAPFIKGKDVDPAVLVVDELGTFVIPLLSGHLGGANEYGEELSNRLKATPVITTATDINQVFGVDVWAKKQKIYINNIDHIKYISAALLAGEKIGFQSDYKIDEFPEFVETTEGNMVETGILISETYRQIYTHTLWLTPKKYVLGVGCRKGIDIEIFEKQLLEFLEEQGIFLQMIRQIASIDLKEKEEAILNFSRKYGIEFKTFSSKELELVSGEFSKSEFVKSVTGVDNVCERSARLASGAKELCVPKTISSGMTMAVCSTDCLITGLNNEKGWKKNV